MNASGENIRPSCASSANTGTNDSVITSSEKNSAGPTSTAASVIRRQRSSPSTTRPSSFLCAFSIITTAASTIAPIAMAIPPSDMMLAFTPW